MITDHVFRPFHKQAPVRLAGVADPCKFASCGRPKAEHARIRAARS